MSNLLASLTAGGNALDALQQALNVVQTNVSNASTPGYARQQALLTAQPMDIPAGLTGGVMFSGVQSARDNYADSAVQRQLLEPVDRLVVLHYVADENDRRRE